MSLVSSVFALRLPADRILPVRRGILRAATRRHVALGIVKAESILVETRFWIHRVALINRHDRACDIAQLRNHGVSNGREAANDADRHDRDQ